VIPLEDARRFVLDRTPVLPPVAVPPARALGLVTAEAVTSAEDVPPFANTAVDGYAVQAADTTEAPVTLRVVGLLPSGSWACCRPAPPRRRPCRRARRCGS